MLTYLAFDPGGITGVCEFNEQGLPIGWHQFKEQELMQYLVDTKTPTVKAWIAEDFLLRKNLAMQQAGSDMPACVVIGILKAFAFINGAKFVLSSPRNLTTAQLHSGVKMPKDHSQSHQISAFLHGYEWLMKQGIVQPKIPERLKLHETHPRNGLFRR